jgi:hypothetical protein
MPVAGKYGQVLNAAARNPAGALKASALGAGLLGATGSVIGNLTDKEQGEGPLRILSEAANAGTLAAIPGLMPGYAAAALGTLRQPGMARKAVNAAGSAANARKSFQGIARGAALATAAVPAAAGLGGLVGGGYSNLYNAIGIPGFQAGINPEAANGSSNMQYV